MYTCTTRDIKVTVFPIYLAEQSLPDENHYVWAYTVHLQNLGIETVQLINRYWHITDGHGVIQEVRGPGVIGEQPTLEPGGEFRYTSGVSLKTPSGIMSGEYELISTEHDIFHIDIPAFSLDSPEQVARPN